MARTGRPAASEGEDGDTGALPLRRRPPERQPPGTTCWAASKRAEALGNVAPGVTRVWGIWTFTSSVSGCSKAVRSRVGTHG